MRLKKKRSNKGTSWVDYLSSPEALFPWKSIRKLQGTHLTIVQGDDGEFGGLNGVTQNLRMWIYLE